MEADKTNPLNAEYYRAKGDRERRKEKQAKADGDYQAAREHDRAAIEYYRIARQLEFGE